MNIDSLTQKCKRLKNLTIFDDWFKVELTYSSNAIEGNTLTRHETAQLIDKGLTAAGKSLNEHLEATNHACALEWVWKKVKEGVHPITAQDILHMHSLILKGIEERHAGCYRTISVRIAGSRGIFPNPLKVPEKMEELMQWLKTASDHPVTLAMEAHYRLVSIHPFVDGNGRVGRLLMNGILMMHGTPPAIIRKRDRVSYIEALEKAQLGGDKEPYIQVIYRAVNRSLDIVLKGVSIVPEDTHLKIGALAKLVGEPVSTIRYWTQRGLLQIADRTESGYHCYTPDMVKQGKRIQKLKQRRYTLEEIRKHLS